MFLRRPLISAGLAGLLIAAACTNQTSTPSLTPLPNPPGSTLAVEQPGFVAPTASTPQPATTPNRPSATLSPTETPAAGFPVLNRDTFQYLEVLVRELGARESATSQELQAAQYLAQEFQAMGYASEIQPFDVERISSETSSLTTSGRSGGLIIVTSLPVNPLNGTAVGQGQGPLVHVGLGGPEDLPEESLEWNVALIQRGIITFQEKVSRVAQSGAAAAVIYNNLPGNFQGTLGQAGSIPAVSISSEDGAKLLDLLIHGPVEATLLVERTNLPSRNVIAEKPGVREGVEDVVVLGGHYDTVADIAGANDNASGTAVLLTLAKQLAERSLPFNVKIIAFGSEELGLLGSRAYLDSLSEGEKNNIVAMLNFDALASGERVTILGSESLTELGEKLAEELGIAVSRRRGLRGGGSDHATFAREGIPVLMFTSPDFSRLHTPNDTLEFVEPRLLGDSARLALALLESEDFPR